MTDRQIQRIQQLMNELCWLRQHARRQPSHWAYSRIAQLEGILAAERERIAWEETRRIIARLMSAHH